MIHAGELNFYKYHKYFYNCIIYLKKYIDGNQMSNKKVTCFTMDQFDNLDYTKIEQQYTKYA